MNYWTKAAFVAVLGMTVATGGAAQASANSELERLAALNPGTSVAQMERAVRQEANRSGRPESEVIRLALVDAEQEAGTIGAKRAKARPQAVGGSGDKTERLSASRYAGDIFWYDSMTDHVGLYSKTTWIIEAPGTGKVVTELLAEDKPAPVNTSKMYVNVSQAKRDASVAWARTKKGKPYNNNFAFNRIVEHATYNCSQLVWAAYTKSAGIDLDSNGGTGVYPGNIRGSKYNVIYSTKQS